MILSIHDEPWFTPVFDDTVSLRTPPLALVNVGDAEVGHPVPVYLYERLDDARWDYAIRASRVGKRCRIPVEQLCYPPAADRLCIDLEHPSERLELRASVRRSSGKGAPVGVVQPSPFSHGQRIVVLRPEAFFEHAETRGMIRSMALVRAAVGSKGN